MHVISATLPQFDGQLCLTCLTSVWISILFLLLISHVFIRDEAFERIQTPGVSVQVLQSTWAT